MPTLCYYNSRKDLFSEIIFGCWKNNTMQGGAMDVRFYCRNQGEAYYVGITLNANDYVRDDFLN